MATDSSSGTLPSSSRLTIDSNSSIARSNGSCAMSLLAFCAIPGSPTLLPTVAWIAPCAIRDSFPGFRCAQSGLRLPLHQRRDVGGDRIAQRAEIIAALEQRHDAALGAMIGDVHDLLRHPDEIVLGEIDASQRIAHVGVEAGGDDDQLRPEFAQPRQDPVLEGRAECLAAVAGA